MLIGQWHSAYRQLIEVSSVFVSTGYILVYGLYRMQTDEDLVEWIADTADLDCIWVFLIYSAVNAAVFCGFM